MNRLSLFVPAAVLLTFLLALPAKADPPVSTHELVEWCSVASEDASEDELLDELSCLMFLQGVLSGIRTAVVRVSDEHWSAGFDGAVTMPRLYCIGDATVGQIKQGILPHLTKAPPEAPGDAVLWSLERAFPCAHSDFWRPDF